MSTASALNSPGSGADESTNAPPSAVNKDKLAVGCSAAGGGGGRLNVQHEDLCGEGYAACIAETHLLMMRGFLFSASGPAKLLQ